VVLACGAAVALAAGVGALSRRGDEPRPFSTAAIPPIVFTDRGVMRVEEEYIPGVVDCELAPFTEERAALEAQAIAARTYLARYLAVKSPLARVPIGSHFQCWRLAAHRRSLDAARATRGLIVRWNGQPISGNYVAGASLLDDKCEPRPPTAFGYRHATWEALLADYKKGTRFPDWAWTEIFVTRNHARRGADVRSTAIGSWGPPNRGALGQHASICLARSGKPRDEILRTFYGADATISF
jgi:hypothetical protein